MGVSGRERRLVKFQIPVVDVAGMKRCSICPGLQPLSAFGKNRARPDGINDKCRLCARAATKRWRQKNRSAWLKKNRRYMRQWRKENPERVACQNRLRLERERAAPGGRFDSARADYRERAELFGRRCAYCPGPFEVFDHAIPLSRGGTNFPENILPSCRTCNLSKATKTPGEFLVWLAQQEAA